MQRLEAPIQMAGQLNTRTSEKTFLSKTSAAGLDGDMQTLDIRSVMSGVSLYLGAVVREHSLRRAAARPAPPADGVAE